MRQIWKYSLELLDYQVLRIPNPATVISAAEQHGAIVLYALVEPGSQAVSREVWIFGTGHQINFGLPPERRCGDPYTEPRFVGTVKMCDGNLMWHIFVR